MIRRSLILIITLLALNQLTSAQAIYRDIKNYQVYYAAAKRNTQEWLCLRRFESNKKTFLLLVDPHNLYTKVDEAALYTIIPMNLTEARKYYQATPYVKAINKAEKNSVNIQDAGIQTGMPQETGITLTADLCPSHKPLDKRIFTDIFNEFNKVELPVPVALSVTGVWMKQHPQDLAWLKDMQLKGGIYITWINHSYNHRVSSTLPLKQNFLLEAGTDIYYEVTETEKAMLKNGLLPSVFFRFPGLISDGQLVTTITNFGLIPVGTDAWLAKGQEPHAGSIVLIHGNGNEPVGVTDFIDLIRSKKRLITDRQWLLYDLRESVHNEFN